MTRQDKTINIVSEADVESSVAEAAGPKEAPRFVWLAAISMLLTVVAWISGGYSAAAAIIISSVSIVTGALALKSHRHSVRNTAITSIIAAAVLLVVICAFFVVIHVGLESV